jgi:hypothetical protein
MKSTRATLESKFTFRLATEADIRALHVLVEASVRGRQANEYTPAQIEGALGTVLGVDTHLIADRTYFVAESFDRKLLAGLRRMVQTQNSLRCRPWP